MHTLNYGQLVGRRHRRRAIPILDAIRLYVRFEASEHQEWLQFLLPILICVYVNRPNIDSSHRIWSIRRLLKRLMCVFRLIYIFNVKTYTTNPWKNCQTMKNRFQ